MDDTPIEMVRPIQTEKLICVQGYRRLFDAIEFVPSSDEDAEIYRIRGYKTAKITGPQITYFES